MDLSYIIIDNFLSDPDRVREYATKLTYPVPTNTHYYPGRNSAERFQLPNMDQIASQLLHETLQGLDVKDPSNHHCKTRLTLAGEEGVDNVHVDNCHWSGILYLTRDQHCEGGTDFFRHKATGTDRAPLTKSEMNALGFKNAQAVWDDLIIKDTNNTEAWEKTMTIPMRYNRLILLRPYFWHAPSPGFGSSIEDGRLIYLLFFNSKSR